MRTNEPRIRSPYSLLVVSEYKGGRILPKYQPTAYSHNGVFTFTGAFTSSVITSTNVPPNVHQTFKVHTRPMAFVPIVLTTPEVILTAQAIAAISTRVKDRPWPTSAIEAMYNATLTSLLEGITVVMTRDSPEVSGGTSEDHCNRVYPSCAD